MKTFKLPKPEDYEGDYTTGLIKAYAKTYALLIEAATVLQSTEEYIDNPYAKILIKNFLNKLS